MQKLTLQIPDAQLQLLIDELNKFKDIKIEIILKKIQVRN